ncbi:MAG: glycerol kinase GlpK [Halanaeroarchaeum sp.]
MSGKYVGALDQGTTGTRFVLFDREGSPVVNAYEAHEQHYPEAGWVEHDPNEILDDAKRVMREALDEGGIDPAEVDAIGLANQRETTLLWEAGTGEPLHPAIVWQDRRTTDRIEDLDAEGKTGWIREKTGLQPDAYFSATKVEWLLDDLDCRDRAARDEIRFGTVDAWLLSQLCGEHVTDVTNASRTMLFDVREMQWDDDLLAEFGVPREILPPVRPSSDERAHGTLHEDVLGVEIPVTGVLGDQQAALFGQACFDPGETKNTYGTGSFLLANTGEEVVESDHGLLTTVAFQRSGEEPRYALEGSIFATGAAIEWLADVSLIEDPAETERLARAVDSTDDVHVVPAFSGLGAPLWDGRARGTIVGLTRKTRREHLVRATLEGIAFRTRDVIEAIEGDADVDVSRLRVDGGVVQNDALCEIQADLLDATVLRPVVQETTALGAAYAAGLASGFWDSMADLRDHWRIDARFEPGLEPAEADDRYDRWRDAVERATGWARD